MELSGEGELTGVHPALRSTNAHLIDDWVRVPCSIPRWSPCHVSDQGMQILVAHNRWSCKRRIPSPPKKCRRTESTPRQRKNTPRSPNYSRNSSTSPASTKRGSSSPTTVRSDLSFRCDAFGGGTGGFLMFVPFRLSLCKRSKHLVGHVLGQASRSFGQQEENDDTVFSYLEG
ncbi:hypothetical protein B296_00039622 [Ensete ventricosum]|uniref:Uncharacterized protein n=1 Tax=Ensete ventricosum TaxID=4639 RepID=A0A426X3Q8_ENSVE|nr:hypothetical protein B296_00039622 [Ensete ventricosum]